MKSALKLAATITALTVAISSFSACSIFDGGNEPSSMTTPVTSYTGDSTEKEEKTEASTQEEPSTEESTAEKIEVESTETILSLIKDYPIGTAGSTGKSVEIAIRLINFTENCDTDAVKSEIEKYKDDLSDEEKEMFAQCFDEIDYMARKLLKGSTDTIKQYISETKEKYDKGNYSTEKYENIFKMLSSAE